MWCHLLINIVFRLLAFATVSWPKHRERSIIFTTQVVYFRISVHFSRKSCLLHRSVYLPNKLYILVVSSVFFTVSDIFFSVSCIFPKISCMYLLDVLDIFQQVFLSETARHSYLIGKWRRRTSPRNVSFVIFLQWKFNPLPTCLTPNFRFSFLHRLGTTVSQFRK